MDPHDAADADADDSGLGFTGLTAFGPGFVGTLSEEARLAPGTRLDDVTIIRFVAEGGMGCVYEGRQGTPSRTVAVKVIRSGTLSPTSAKRFLHEAHVLGRLSHPGIARIFSAGMHRAAGGPLPFFVMEYLEDAAAITDRAAALGLSVRDRVRLFRDACQAVAHGHQRGVIHRDLKPSNILVDAHGHPKVIDFGVARSTDGDIALTTMHTDVGQLVGTLRYMSPEQFEGTADDIDVRADVYALGVVLYELLTTRLPYDLAGKAVHQVASVVQEVEPRRLGLVDRRLRGDLETIVRTCLEKDRTRRYSSAAELAADLDRWLAGDAIAAARPGLVESLVRLGRRHRLAATAAAAVTTAVFAGTAGVGIFAMKADHARRQATALAAEAAAGREDAQQERDRADAEAVMAKKLLVAANLRSIQAALSEGNRQAARQLLAETVALTPGEEPLEVRCLAAEVDDAVAVIAVGRPATSVAFSPTGDTLGLTSTSGPPECATEAQLWRERLRETVAFFDVASGQPADQPVDNGWAEGFRQTARRPDDASEAAAGRLATAADASRALVYGGGGAIAVVEPATGRPLATLDAPPGRLRTARFSRDGSRVAGVDLRGLLILWDTADGHRLASLGHEREKVTSFLFCGDATRLAAAVSIADAADVILVQDAVSGRPVSRITLPLGYNAAGVIAAISHDGAMVATGSRQGLLDLWDTATGTRLGRLADDRVAVESIAFSPDGSRLASGSPSGRIMIWDVATRSRLRDLVGHDGIVTSLAFHPDGSRLASACLDGMVRLWQLDGPRRLSTLDLASPLTAAAFSPDGSLVAIAGEAAPQVEVWRVDTVRRLAVLTGTDGRVADIAWSPDGQMVAAGFSTPGRVGEARLWRIDAAGAGTSLPGHASGAVSVAFTPDGRRLVTAAADGFAMAWDTTTGRRLWVAAEPHRMRLARLPAVVVGGGRGVAHGPPHLLDIETGGVMTPLRDRGRVICLATDATGAQFASGMAIGTAYVVATSDGAIRARLVGHDDAVCATAFSPDGSRLATGSLDGTVRLWLTDGNTIEQGCLSGHGGAVEAVAFSPDGSRLLTAAADGDVRLWDPALGRLLCVLPAVRGAARAAAISPDGRFVLAGTESGGVRIWGLTNAAVAAARRHSGPGLVAGRPGESPLPGRFLQRRKEGGEVGEILTVEAEGPQVR